MINPHCLFCNKQIAPTIYEYEIPGLVSKLITCPNCNIDYHWSTSPSESIELLNGISIWRYKIPIKHNLFVSIYIDANRAYINTDRECIIEFDNISNLICLNLNQLKEKILKLIVFL